MSGDLHLDHTTTGTNLPTQEGRCIRGSDSTLSSMGRVSMFFFPEKTSLGSQRKFLAQGRHSTLSVLHALISAIVYR